MKWPEPGRAFFWVLVFLLVTVSGAMVHELTRTDQTGDSFTAFARMSSAEQERWLAFFILQEVQDLVPTLTIRAEDLEENRLDTLEVLVEINHETQRKALADRMQAVFMVISQFGYYGERREGDGGDRYYVFRDFFPWLVLDALFVPVSRIALVIDDFGYSMEEAELFLSLPREITMAVFPHLPLSPAIARKAHEAGREIIIHFPMEAIDPVQNEREPFLLRTGSDRATVEQMMQEALAGVPHAIGLNNHKGSRATSDPALMEKFMHVLSGQDFFFLDSVTSSDSVAHEYALAAGIPSLRRDVFLDGIHSQDYVLERLNETVSLARKQGQAIAIGHPRQSTFSALKEFFDTFHDTDIEFVSLSELIQ